MARKRLGDMLVEEGVVTDEQIGEALSKGREQGLKLGEMLIQLGYVNESIVADVLSHQLKIKRVKLADEFIDSSLVELFSGEMLRKNTMIPLHVDENNMNILYVAMADPMDMNAMDEIGLVKGHQIQPVISTKYEIETALDKFYSDSETEKQLKRFKQQHAEDFGDEQESDDDSMVENSPVVQLVRSMMQQAARQRASDIHIEAMEDCIRVRFRIDGVLHERFKYDASMLAAIMARIKIVGGMDIAEKRKPQDGRISMSVDNVLYDVRVSILPTSHGEKCVMRLAQKKALTRDKKDLGLNADDEAKFDNLLRNPNGILLVTGPTGSGKSTTLYTVLSELNNEDVNIITVEDPVEADINGINQVQVNPKAELTFASALRSILRQDPDIIMIGEIRDGETAEIAVQASITGHLVVSTLHTNSSAGAMTRLMDMGVDSYLLADSIFGVIAQRLVRKLCPDCKIQDDATVEEKQLLGVDPAQPMKLFKPCGCDKCGKTGYSGRIGVYEILTVTPRVKEMINKRASADEIKDVAVSEGMSTLRESAKRLVFSGTTSVNEMLRITFEN